MNDDKILSAAMAEFNTMAPAKFLAGKKEHGGDITDRDCLNEAKKEVVDLWMYLTGLEANNQRMREHICNLERRLAAWEVMYGPRDNFGGAIKPDQAEAIGNALQISAASA